MTLPLLPTLVDVRNSVVTRVGAAAGGNLSARQTPLLDETIREAHSEIFVRAPWARRFKETTIIVIDGEREYDIPDDATLGGMGLLFVENVDGRRIPLRYETSYLTENFDTDVKSIPSTWQVVNEVIRVSPPPDATQYPQFVMQYLPAQAPLVADQDRVTVDGEAVIKLAVLKLKSYFGIGGELGMQYAAFERYLKDLCNVSAVPRSFSIASQRVDGPAYWGLGSRWSVGQNAPFTSSWNPW